MPISELMTEKSQNIYRLLKLFFSFTQRVLRGFIRNQGFMMSGAVAYYTLMSIVPISIIVLIVLSNFIDEQQLILTLSRYLGMVVPGYASTLTDQARAFLEHRKVVGFIGFLGMLFFSSTAFSILENAMSIIFSQRLRIHRRNFFVSAIIPYIFIFVMGLVILLVSFLVGTIETMESSHVTFLGWRLEQGTITWITLYILGIAGEMLMFSAIYFVMPVVQVRFRHALIGGITAAVLWEVTRRILIWYYSTVSMVNVIYGSIAITIVALLSIEVVAMILLLGAQIIAELEQIPDKTAAKKQSEFENG